MTQSVDYKSKIFGFARSGVKIGSNLRSFIPAQGPKIVVFSGSCSTFLFYSFGTVVIIKIYPRNCRFPKRPKL